MKKITVAASVMALSFVPISSAVANNAVFTHVSPNSGSTEGGNTVTVHGSYFVESTYVKVGSTIVPDTFVDSNTMTVVMPARSAGLVSMSIWDGSMGVVLPNAYEYIVVTPEPEPTPDPDPTPDPEPEPTPDPEPEPTPDPEPNPTENPVENPENISENLLQNSPKVSIYYLVLGKRTVVKVDPSAIVVRVRNAFVSHKEFRLVRNGEVVAVGKPRNKRGVVMVSPRVLGQHTIVIHNKRKDKERIFKTFTVV